MTKLNLSRHLPLVGILAFSLCSVWSLYHLFEGNARHATPIFWGAAALVEIVTAWLVYMSVQQVHHVTRSKISKQDRRFYLIVLVAFLALTLPTLATSIWANYLEFGSLALGALFPIASVGCAIGAALPDAVTGYETRRRTENDNKKKDTTARRKEKETQAEKACEREREQIVKEREKALEALGSASETLRAITENPGATQAQIAQLVGISRRSVVNHLSKLEEAGCIERNGQGVKVL